MYKIIKERQCCVRNIIRNFSNSAKPNSNATDNVQSVLGNAYVPREIEQNREDVDYFYSDKKLNEQFTLLLPPPNITGTLHLGHALAVTIQDVLIRWNRMRGMQTLWIPGMDHAGIATQVVVEKKLWKEEHRTRQDLGRDLFVKEIYKWKEEKANVIGQQLRQMGASLDWSRQMFTMDPAQSRAVTEAFIKLYECGLIYRSDYLVNWSCVLGSAISDIEVEHLSVNGATPVSVPGYENPVQFGTLTKFAYKLHDSDEEIVVATTRPETILGDTAVAVHPKDERYASFIGKMCWHPFRNEKIPIVCDEMVDPEFGTGAVKITPAHDHADFAVAKRHNLDLLQVIDEKGTINCGPFKDVRRFDVRNDIVDELSRLNLLRGKQDHEMLVPLCSRSKDVVEFLLKPQWFLKCDDMARKALSDVKEGRLRIEPERFVKDWTNWLENIRDWCISRQLWWGHQIPMYFCHVEGDPDRTCNVAARDLESAKSQAALALGCQLNNIVAVQDEDVLDTWFSSALLPFSAFGWPDQTSDLKHFYPLTLMETGHDILFFWVARMVMLGTHLTGQLPFPKVLLHGIICDAQGRKMSKSLGNVIAPEDIILGSSLQDLEGKSRTSHAQGVLTEDELVKALRSQKKMFPEGIPDCGADALRFTLCSHNIKNHYISFDVQECKTNKFFGNKLWQAVKFTNKWIDSVSEAQEMGKVKYERLGKLDKWILSRLSLMVETVNGGLEKYELHSATNALKNFLYYEFCDIYLETAKRGLRHVDGPMASGHCWTLNTCLDVGLRCLSPFMPTLSRHLHRHLRTQLPRQRHFHFPEDLPWRDVGIEEDVDKMMEVVVAIRRLKKMFNLTAKHKPKVLLVTQLSRLRELRDAVKDLSGCDEITVENEIESDDLLSVPTAFTTTAAAVAAEATVSDSVVGGDVTIHLTVPSELRRTFEVDLQKLEKKRSKLVGELHKVKKITTSDGYKLKASEKEKEGFTKKIVTLEESIARIDYMQRLSKSFVSKKI